MPSGTSAAALPTASAAVYRSRRPALTLLHKVMRENLETYLTGRDFGTGWSHRTIAEFPIFVSMG